MSLNLSQLQTALKRYGFDDEDPLTTWINAALRNFEDAHEWSFLNEVADIVLTSGDDTVTLPSDFFKPISVVDITTNTSRIKLDPWDTRRFFREVGDGASTGEPDRYTLIGLNVLQVYPIPSSDRTIRMLYQRTIADLSDSTDIPDIPERFHYAIVLGAAAIALQAENEEDRAANALSQFENAIGDAAMKLALEDLDEPRQVQDTAGYFED